MTEAVELTDEALIARMVDGDEEAFSALYRRKHPSVYRFALRMSGNRALAEDVTQEVFVALIRDAKRFDPAKGAFAAFLFGIARNHLHKRWELDKRLVPSGLGNESANGNGSRNGDHFSIAIQSGAVAGNGNGNGASHGPIAGLPEEFVSKETVARVRKAIATLPENYREAVILCDLEELSYDEAAVALGCPVGTVRSRLHRGRAILMEKLEEQPVIQRAPAVGE
ncbi:MAG TPA: RNA polymerase sigma factor [Candidatus Aquilonibacter sp.]|nr:RNA polymerase sigma factor [Candidatus Aquilonibacter sp.]